MAELADPSTKLVLIVDDDKEVRGFLETVLGMEGYQVQTANSGAEALEKIRVKVPDLIITDLMMPDVGGYDLLRSLQAEDQARVPVIVSTARRMDASTEELIRGESNVVGFLNKPVSLPALQALLWNVLKVQPRKRERPSGH